MFSAIIFYVAMKDKRRCEIFSSFGEIYEGSSKFHDDLVSPSIFELYPVRAMISNLSNFPLARPTVGAFARRLSYLGWNFVRNGTGAVALCFNFCHGAWLAYHSFANCFQIFTFARNKEKYFENMSTWLDITTQLQKLINSSRRSVVHICCNANRVTSVLIFSKIVAQER